MVKSYISAIKAILKEDGVKITEDQYTLAALIRACRIKNNRLASRMPIQSSMLSVLLSQIKFKYNNNCQPYLQSCSVL